MNFMPFIYLVIIFFSFGELLRFEFSNNIALKALDVCVLTLAVIWLFSKIKKRSLYKIVRWYYLIFPGVGLLSLLLNLGWLNQSDFFVSSLYLLRWIAYFSIFLIVLEQKKESKSKINFLLFLSGFFILMAGYLQYFFFNSLKPFFFLGWDEHMHRMFSVFLDPNFAGSFYVLFFIFLFSFIKNYQENKNKIVIKFIMVMTFIAILLTFSRSAILMLITGMSVYFFLLKNKKTFFKFITTLIFFLTIATAFFYDENMNLLRTHSGLARLKNYEEAILIIKDNPIFGIGFNAYRYAKDKYGIKHGWVDAPSHSDAGIENSWLFIIATTGIVGLVSYLLLWKKILTIIANTKSKNSQSVYFLSSVLALAVNALFINSLFYTPIMLWMWIIAALNATENSK